MNLKRKSNWNLGCSLTLVVGLAAIFFFNLWAQNLGKYTLQPGQSVELKKSGIDIKEVSNNLANDILSIHEGDMKQRNYLINEGRKVWKSPGDDIMINSADLTQVSIDLTDFVNLVNTGKPLDLKSRNYNDELEFSLWSRKWEGNLRDDYLGNYLFGYVAKGYLCIYKKI